MLHFSESPDYELEADAVLQVATMLAALCSDSPECALAQYSTEYIGEYSPAYEECNVCKNRTECKANNES